MPTVGRWNGITVLAYFLDHEKWDEHVHCRAGEAEVKISLLDFSVKRVYGTMSTADVRKAVRVVKAHLNEAKRLGTHAIRKIRTDRLRDRGGPRARPCG